MKERTEGRKQEKEGGREGGRKDDAMVRQTLLKYINTQAELEKWGSCRIPSFSLGLFWRRDWW